MAQAQPKEPDLSKQDSASVESTLRWIYKLLTSLTCAHPLDQTSKSAPSCSLVWRTTKSGSARKKSPRSLRLASSLIGTTPFSAPLSWLLTSTWSTNQISSSLQPFKRDSQSWTTSPMTSWWRPRHLVRCTLWQMLLKVGSNYQLIDSCQRCFRHSSRTSPSSQLAQSTKNSIPETTKSGRSRLSWKPKQTWKETQSLISLLLVTTSLKSKLLTFLVISSNRPSSRQ